VPQRSMIKYDAMIQVMENVCSLHVYPIILKAMQMIVND